MRYEERAVLFDCAGERLVGVLSQQSEPRPVGVLVIVGGPQYRVGSHRQFVLLARHLAEHGYPVLRFDYRGMGDSTGDIRTFEEIGGDIACAIDAFEAAVPPVHSIVLWGLCDAASAAMIVAHRHPRVAGMVLLNPWARSDETYAKAQLRHYYLDRVLSWAFWRKVIAGGVHVHESARSLARAATTAARSDAARADYRRAMFEGLRRFRGRVLLVLSGRDLTAQEFLGYVNAHPEWLPLLAPPRAERLDLPDMDHTFSSHSGRAEVAHATTAFLGRVVDARVATT